MSNKEPKNQMHPRNIFKKPPDYTELAIKYRDFRHVCKLELSGKVCIDYKNEIALRTLTQTLLLEYFDLKVEFAPGSLVPTLPLRLNYILWIEDLLNWPNKSSVIVKGIDIGCGSSCIYSLLVAKKNQWQMLALESNEINLKYAQNNINENQLQTLIKLYTQTNKNQIFQEYFNTLQESATEVYDFCLCNPPFFDNQSESNKSRKSNKRPPPHNCPTGYKEELSCQGGEVKFVEKIIDESLAFKQNVRIFTTMLGVKSSLNQILNILKAKDIANVCTTEFHQGNTTRWGVAWSFFNEIDLKIHQ
ncbi:hypothetical protein DOY81_000792 [Sarcophaga bullata]|nr:hypothetical protein DOY81_000792 [Sarcophaga bullata]